jgi:hypothetical protein
LSRCAATSSAAAAALLLLAACASPPAPICEAGGIEVRAGFPQAGLAGCTVEAGAIAARITPETQPINPSPWYAFEIRGAPPGATVRLSYEGGAHRYHPWVRDRRGTWQRLPDDAVSPTPGGAEIRLPPARGPILLAGQPFPTPDAILAPFERRARAGTLTAETITLTPRGRPIRLFLHRPPAPEGLIVLLTRQHPPEIPGGRAFDALAARLLDESPEARALRARHAILFAPLMNPDGVAAGHWRGNATGTDLNRDWGAFAQPETRAVAGRIGALAAAMPALLMLDLHSTNRHVLYAQPETLAAGQPSETFLASFRQTPAGAPFAVSRSQNASTDGTFKAWTFETLKVASLTFEVADATTPDEAAAIGRAAADAILMTLAKDRP